MLLMGLRLQEGIALSHFQARTGLQLTETLDPVILAAAVEEGYLVHTPTHLYATEEGRLRLEAYCTRWCFKNRALSGVSSTLHWKNA